MTRRVLPVLQAALFSLVSIGAFADVTLKTTMTVAGPTSLEAATDVRLKGTKMRADLKGGSQDLSVLADLATRERLLVNHVTKEIQPFDPFGAAAALPLKMGEPTVSVKPTTEKREILGRQCQGFSVNVSVPITLGAETLTLLIAGPAWVAVDGPGVAEYQRFFKAAAAGEGIATMPLGQGPQGRALVEMQNRIGALGIPLEHEMRVSMQGGGQMAAAMGQKDVVMTSRVTEISTAPVADDVFAAPAGYTRKQERP